VIPDFFTQRHKVILSGVEGLYEGQKEFFVIRPGVFVVKFPHIVPLTAKRFLLFLIPNYKI